MLYIGLYICHDFQIIIDAEKGRFYGLAWKDIERYNAKLAVYGEYLKWKCQKNDPNAPK